MRPPPIRNRPDDRPVILPDTTRERAGSRCGGRPFAFIPQTIKPETDMNKDRRATITDIKGDIDDLRQRIEEVRDDEQEAHDNMPEYLQDGAPGQKMDEAIAALEEALDTLDQVDGQLDTAAA